ncbi:MAG: hypothetical protein MI923_08175, partial [Phycisphaerales bacterium]|nr:hypothetical protein [Phycisphaerales bacterium]
MRHDSIAFPDDRCIAPYAQTGPSTAFRRFRPMFDSNRDGGLKPRRKRALSAALGLLLMATAPVITALPSLAQTDKTQTFILKENGPLKKEQLTPAPGGTGGGAGGGAGGGGSSTTTFYKIVEKSCRQLTFTFALNVPVHPELQDKDITDVTDSLRLDFSDTIPGANPQFTGASVSGEIVGPGGAPAPSVQISTSANPNDTLTLEDFRLSGLDQDGDPANRTVIITAYAEINPDGAAGDFVDNQAFIDLSTDVSALTFPSHDPALPDD